MASPLDLYAKAELAFRFRLAALAEELSPELDAEVADVETALQVVWDSATRCADARRTREGK